MIEIIRPSISSAYEALWKRVWNYGQRSTDSRGDAVRVLRRVWVEIARENHVYPQNCPVPREIADTFAMGLLDDDVAYQMGANFEYAYGARIREEGALDAAVRMLKGDPGTRRAVLPIFLSGDPRRAIGGGEVPCVTQVYLTIEEGSLEMTVFMRSNDVLNAFPSDVYGFRNLQALIAHDLGVDRGKYYHYIENAHIIEHSSQDWIEKQNRRVE